MTPEDPRQNWAAPGGANDEPDADSAGGGNQTPPDPNLGANQWGAAQPGANQWGAAPGSQQGGYSDSGQQGGGWGSGPGGTYGAAPGGGPGGFQPMQPLQPGVIPLRALGVSEILDGAFKAIRHNPRVIFGMTLPIAALTALFQGLLIVRVFSSIDYEYMESSDPFEAFVDTDSLLYSLAGILLAVFFVPLVTGLLTLSVSRSTMGQKLSISETWQMLHGRKLALVGASILSSLISMGSVLVIGLAVPINMIAGDDAALISLLPLSVIALILALYLSTRLLFVPQVLVLERQGVFAAFKRGWLLTRGSFWRVLGIYLLASVISSVVSSLVSTPISMVGGILTFLSPLLTALITGLATIVSLLVTIPYTASSAAILYIDIRMRREGLDIQLARAAGENR